MTTTVVFQLPLRFGDADHHSQLLNRQLQELLLAHRDNDSE